MGVVFLERGLKATAYAQVRLADWGARTEDSNRPQQLLYCDIVCDDIQSLSF